MRMCREIHFERTNKSAKSQSSRIRKWSWCVGSSSVVKIYPHVRVTVCLCMSVCVCLCVCVCTDLCMSLLPLHLWHVLHSHVHEEQRVTLSTRNFNSLCGTHSLSPALTVAFSLTLSVSLSFSLVMQEKRASSESATSCSLWTSLG